MAKKEAFLLAVMVCMLAALPNWYGAWNTPSGGVFLWSGYPWDSNQYFAFMRVGYRDQWLFTNLLTSEAHQPVLLMPFFVAMGHVAAWYSDYLTWSEGAEPSVTRTIPIVYHNSRLLLTLVLFLLIYWLASLLTVRRARRLWTVAFAAFASGIGWGQTIPTESHILSSCILFPNFIASLICYVLICGSLLIALRDETQHSRAWHYLLPGAIGGFILPWIHPFDLPPLAILSLALFTCRWLQSRSFPRRLFFAGLNFAIFSAIPVLHMLNVLHQVEDFRIINASNLMPWKHWWSSLLILEASLFCALLALPALIRNRKRPQPLFVLLWLMIALSILLVPLPFQRRMMEGVPLALAFALPFAVESVLIRPVLKWRNTQASTSDVFKLSRARFRLRLVRHSCYFLVLILLLPKTLWVLYDRGLLTFSKPKEHYYIYQQEVDAMAWLEQNSDWREVVWAPVFRGNRVPFLSGNRVFFGHGVLTVFANQKQKITEDLFSGKLSVQQFRQTILDYGIDYIYWAETDRPLHPTRADFSTFDPEFLGKPIYDNGFAKIFRVKK